MTIKDLHTLPHIGKYVDYLGEVRIFSTEDDFNGYWQINKAEKDRLITCFVCHSGTFQYKLIFGLTKAPDTFQRLLNLIITRYKS